MNIQQRYRMSVRLLFAVLALGAYLSLTRPTDVPLVLLPVPFLLVFYIFFLVFRWVVQRLLKMSERRTGFIAVLLAVFPTLILILSSLNQLSLVDVAVVTLLLFGGLFYLRYADFLS